MAASGFTPIQLYYSTTATNTPLAANLAVGELAVNAADGKLYYKNSITGLVSLLANASSATGNLPGGGVGTVVYQSSTGVTAYLTLGATNRILTAGPTAPQYVDPGTVSVGYADAAGEASDILGGAANRIVYQLAADSTDFIVAPTIPGYVLSWTGSAFAWAAAPAATSAIDLAGGVAGAVPYQVAPGDTAFTAAGTAGFLLTSGGTAIPTWTNPATLSVSFATTAGSATTAASATTAIDISGGLANQILYQTAPGNTDFLPTGTAGQVLTSQGSGAAPAWQAPAVAVTKSFVYFCAQF